MTQLLIAVLIVAAVILAVLYYHNRVIMARNEKLFTQNYQLAQENKLLRTRLSRYN